MEGEYVHVASAVGGWLERLLVQRGQTIEAKTPLFNLEAEQETAAKQQADEQLKAAQAHLADLRLGRRTPEVDVARAQLAQAMAAEEQAAQQLSRDAAQFEIGGIARAQLDDSRANHAIKQARCASSPANWRCRGCRRAWSRSARRMPRWRQRAQWRASRTGGSTKDACPQARPHWWSTPCTARANGCPRAARVVRLLPPQNLKVRFFVPQAVAGALKPRPQRLAALRRLRCRRGGTGELTSPASPNTRHR